VGSWKASTCLPTSTANEAPTSTGGVGAQLAKKPIVATNKGGSIVVVIPISQLAKRIPRDGGGDPSFLSLEAVMEVLTPEQALECINRYLKQAEYVAEANRKWSQRRRQQVKDLHQRARVLYPHTPFERLTREQMKEVIENS